jgi:hypothetical protein
MKPTIKYLVILLFTATLVGCNDGITLQRYFVDNQESVNFTSVDLPATFLSLDEATLNRDLHLKK